MDAFYTGLQSVHLNNFEFLCKFDLDLDIPPRYFEILIYRIRQNPFLGT
ncbi:MAG: hypothetical protein N2035_01855 [Chthoniobacterales bacterium]|nr:hypothetical protein [Chthoniobacterales bacterium]